MSDILWTITLTLVVYLMFFYIQKKTKLMILNPLFFTSVFIIICLVIFKIDYNVYKEGSSFITFLIGPATVSLAIPLYEKLPLLKKHYKTILLTITTGVITHAIIIGLMAFVLNISHELIATFIPKSVTTPIAKEISLALGGIEELTIAIVIITGIFGSIIAPYIFKILKVENSIAIGLSLGISAHAIGTSKAIELGEEEASMSTLALILTGILTVVLSPLFYKIIVSII